jgi:hypothetical protein
MHKRSDFPLIVPLPPLASAIASFYVTIAPGFLNPQELSASNNSELCYAQRFAVPNALTGGIAELNFHFYLVIQMGLTKLSNLNASTATYAEDAEIERGRMDEPDGD